MLLCIVDAIGETCSSHKSRSEYYLSPEGEWVVVSFRVGAAVEALVVVVSGCWVGDCEGVTEEVVGGEAVGVVAFFIVVGINSVV